MKKATSLLMNYGPLYYWVYLPSFMEHQLEEARNIPTLGYEYTYSDQSLLIFDLQNIDGLNQTIRL